MGRRRVKTYHLTVQREGDDLVLVFPVEVLDAMGAKPGDEIVWELQPDGTVTIRPTFGDTAIEANIGDALEKCVKGTDELARCPRCGRVMYVGKCGCK